MIPDDNARVASILSGEIDASMSNLGSIDQAVAVRDQWRGGIVRFDFGSDSWIGLHPQFLNPQPAAVADLRFRRALLHAIDRESMADTLQHGLSPVPQSYMSPNQPAYAEMESRLPRYEYDHGLAERTLGELGFGRGADGMLRSTTGARLEIELRTGANEQAAKPGAAVADSWQQIGVTTNYYRMTAQQQQDGEYSATFPSFSVFNGRVDVGGLYNLHSSRAPRAENRYRVPGGQGNKSRYMNTEFDELIDQYFVTVPVPERLQVLSRILFHVADQLPVMGLYYNPRPEAISDRLLGASRDRTGGELGWNAHEWDVRS